MAAAKTVAENGARRTIGAQHVAPAPGTFKRTVWRQKSFQPGFWVERGERKALHLLDISEHGARAHSPRPPTAGERVLVHCELPLGQAVVRWVSDKTFGLEFVVPISSDTVSAVLRLPPK
jgi:hypothetical protein